jgi:hypothetical protein
MKFISDPWTYGKVVAPPLSHPDYRIISPPTTAPLGQKRRWTNFKNSGRGSRCDLPGQIHFPFVMDGVKQDLNRLVDE